MRIPVAPFYSLISLSCTSHCHKWMTNVFKNTDWIGNAGKKTWQRLVKLGEQNRKCIGFFEMQLIRNSTTTPFVKQSLIKIANFALYSSCVCLVAPYCKQTNKQFPSQILGLDWKLFPAFQRTAGGLWNLNGVTKALIQRESSSIMYLTPNCFWSLTKYLFFCWCCSNISKNQVTIKELKEEEQKGEIKTSKCCLSYIQNVIRLTKQPMFSYAAANPTPSSMWFPEYMISISYVSQAINMGRKLLD